MPEPAPRLIVLSNAGDDAENVGIVLLIWPPGPPELVRAALLRGRKWRDVNTAAMALRLAGCTVVPDPEELVRLLATADILRITISQRAEPAVERLHEKEEADA